MKLQYAPFLLPLYTGSAEQEDLNRFLRRYRIVQTKKELIAKEGDGNLEKSVVFRGSLAVSRLSGYETCISKRFISKN